MEKVDCSYYVYLYLKPNGTPFYVGKGKGSRWQWHLSDAKREKSYDPNGLKRNTIRKILASGQEPIVKFVDTGISEEQAFELENFLISEIGRIDLGTGPLTNLSEGGEGFAGHKHTDESKRKISEANKGRPRTATQMEALRRPRSDLAKQNMAIAREKMTYVASEETRQKIREKAIGRKSPLKGKPSNISDEGKQRLREILKERNEQIVTCPYCGKIGKFVAMIRYHMENCKEKEKQDAISE